jgi:L-lactate dehydrogenase complex protein LldE
VKASLFITCLVDNFYPNVGVAMARILSRYGVTLDFPSNQTCCGQPAFNSGYIDEAKSVALSWLDAFEHADYVISPSGSCTGMVHHYYPKLFEGDPMLAARAEQLSRKTYEFTQYLVSVLGVTDLGAVFPHKVTYHPSCHGSRLLGVKDEPLRLLENVRNLQFIDLPYANDCCGFGGTFAVKMPDISTAMVSEKVGHVLDTGAEVLVGTDMGCLMNIGGRLRHQNQPMRVMHIAQLLDEGIQNAEGVAR